MIFFIYFATCFSLLLSRSLASEKSTTMPLSVIESSADCLLAFASKANRNLQWRAF